MKWLYPNSRRCFTSDLRPDPSFCAVLAKLHWENALYISLFLKLLRGASSFVTVAWILIFLRCKGNSISLNLLAADAKCKPKKIYFCNSFDPSAHPACCTMKEVSIYPAQHLLFYEARKTHIFWVFRTCYSLKNTLNYFSRQDVSSCSIGLADPGPSPGARGKLRTDSETGYGEEDTGNMDPRIIQEDKSSLDTAES